MEIRVQRRQQGQLTASWHAGDRRWQCQLLFSFSKRKRMTLQQTRKVDFENGRKQQSANCGSNNRRQWHRQFVAPGPAEYCNSKIKNQKQQLTSYDEKSTRNQQTQGNSAGIIAGQWQ